MTKSNASGMTMFDRRNVVVRRRNTVARLDTWIVGKNEDCFDEMNLMMAT